MADAVGEISRLQREVDYLRRQREILKKSTEHPLGGPAERYALITTMRENYSITELCDALGVSPSGYHAAKKRLPGQRHQQNQRLLQAMKSIHFHRHTRGYGSPRMARELRNHGYCCSGNRAARLMRSAGLRARPRRPFRPKTNQPDHAAHPSPNLLP